MSVRFPIEVHFALGADPMADPTTWAFDTDITDFCLVREGGVSMGRGRDSWQTTAEPAWCELLINNADGRFSRLNANGPYFGQLRKNTPIRVRMNPGGGMVTMFTGLTSELPQRWDPSETDKWVRLRADGVRRRVSRSRSEAKSPMRRTILAASPVAYWSMEDGPTSSAVAGGTPLRSSGVITAGADSDLAGSAPLPVFSSTGAQVFAPVVGLGSTSWRLEMYVRTQGDVGASQVARLLVNGTMRTIDVFTDTAV